MENADCTPGNMKGVFNQIAPSERLKCLKEFAKTMDVDYAMNPNGYFSNGIQCVQEAERLFREGDYENSYVLYMKFLMVNSKIKFHPQYWFVPLDTKSVTNYKFADAMKKVKIIEKKVLTMYELHNKQYKNELKEISLKSSPSYKKSYELIKDTQTSACDVGGFELHSFHLLRTLVIPNQLPTIFQIILQSIYRHGTSAYGLLAGSKRQKEFVVTHLLIPIQSGLSDFNLDEADCCKYIKDNDLIKQGWIHIHKASTFMSSKDMHLHYHIQKEFPEAICIVCSPRLTEVSMYSLLEYGLCYVGSCVKEQCHAHKPYQALYSIARHVKIVYDTELEVVDFREKAASIMNPAESFDSSGSKSDSKASKSLKASNVSREKLDANSK